jgi:hypothetical protein
MSKEYLKEERFILADVYKGADIASEPEVRQNIMAMRHVAEATHLIMERKEREGE